MGNSSSSNTTIIQNFGTTNIDSVLQEIKIPGFNDYPKNDLQAQLEWINNSSLKYLENHWSDNFSYSWQNKLTAPDGAVTHDVIQGTAWIDPDTSINNYLQDKMGGSSSFNQEQLFQITSRLNKVVHDLLDSIEKGFRSDTITIDNKIGDNKVNVFYCGGTLQGLNSPVLFVSYLINWYSPKSL